ncbi:MAG: ATP-binding cassette domain-containing protein, partial [Rhodospirillales bacterium]
MAGLTLKRATRRFAGPRAAVDAVDLDVADGEFLAVLGPSGCGKTTLLRLVAGFEQLDDGEIAFDGDAVSGPRLHVPPEERRVGVVFQSYALWPHMTVKR